MAEAGDPADDVSENDQGLTEFRIDARGLLDANVTRVTVEAGAQSLDLPLNPSTNTYDGAMLLPAGAQNLVARAFSGTTLVGVSNPTAVTIETGQVLHVAMRILDVTGSPPPVYGPILDSLVFPTTAQANAPATFTTSVIAPVGDPVSYAWSSNCSDATFSTPSSSTTTWTKPAQGACTITMIATSNGLSIAQNFEIVVFPPGSSSGGADVSASFVSTPSLYLSLHDVGCYIWPGYNASCAGMIASPNVSSYSVTVTNWGGSTPGPITLSDNCGGQFGMASTTPESRSGHWLPPAGGGVCIITAHATSGDGVVSTVSAAVLVRAGTPPTAQAPQISGNSYPGPYCVFDSSSSTPMDCGSIPAGTQLFPYGYLNWGSGHPGSLTLSDDCNGGLIQPDYAYSFSTTWNLPSTPGQICTMTVRATSLQGSTSEASVRYHLQ